MGAGLHAVGMAGFWYGSAQQSHHCNSAGPVLTTLQRNPEKHRCGEFLKVSGHSDHLADAHSSMTRSNEILMSLSPSFNSRFIPVSHVNYDFTFSGGAEFHHWTEIHRSHFPGATNLVPEIGSGLTPGQPFTRVGEMRCRIWAWQTSGWLFWSWLALLKLNLALILPKAQHPGVHDSALILP